jgi:RNA-directed DNA polymerase
MLGVPTVDDRIAQTVAAMQLEREVEPLFHPDSYGYRRGRSALDAVAACRERCWRNDWGIDLDVGACFDSVDHSLMRKAVARHTDQRWILLYVKRWLVAPLRQPDAPWWPGIAEPRKARRSHPGWRTCSCSTRSIRGWPGSSRRSRSSGTAMMR